MVVFDRALVLQQERRKAFLAERNFLVGNCTFLLANLGYWLYLLAK